MGGPKSISARLKNRQPLLAKVEAACVMDQNLMDDLFLLVLSITRKKQTNCSSARCKDDNQKINRQKSRNNNGTLSGNDDHPV